MDYETSKGTFLAVTVSMVVVVVMMGLSMFSQSRGMLNDGQTRYIKTIDNAANASLSDYDDTTVSGLKVRSAIEDYEGKTFCVVVNTAALQKKICGNAAKDASAAASKAVSAEPNFSQRESYTGRQFTVLGQRYYTVYDAMLDIDAGAELTVDATTGNIIMDGVFKTQDGIVVSDTHKANWKTSGCTEYINQSANYNCKLIRDLSGTVVGIMATEVY